MLASEIRKKYLTPEEINEIVNSEGLKSIQPFLEDVLKESRNPNITTLELLKLQGKIAIRIIKCEKQMSILKNKSDREKKNVEWRSREIYRAHRKMLKEVMDGLAFRILNFERPVLRQLAEHNQTGYLTEGFLEELKKAEYIVRETGFYVILNDLTNFLRYGDLTIISPEGNIIDEVKTSGKSKGNQKKALDKLIEMLNKKVFKAGNQTAQYVQIHGKPITFLNQVETIINKSKQSKEGIFAERVSPYLWVSSTYIPRIIEYYKSSGKFPEKPVIPFKIDSAPMNSLMFFDEFAPNIPPYSIFPFSEKIIAEIMTGQIQLKVCMSENLLIRSFKNKGWELTIPSKDVILEIYDTDDINKIKESIVDPKYHATLKKGEFSYQLPRENLLRIQSEFRSVKSIIDESEGIMLATADRIPRMITTNFTEEYMVWK